MSIQEDGVSQIANMAYIRKAMSEPMLEREIELDYARRWRENGDESALHSLIKSYTRLVIAAVSKYRKYGLPVSDLIQEGNVGLMQAASRFDPDRNIRFSTYAAWWIRSCMQDFVLRNWSIVRTGTTAAQKSLFFNLRRLRSQIDGMTGSESLSSIDHGTIATKLGVRVKDVVNMEKRLSSGGDQSMNAPVRFDGIGEWGDLLQDSDEDSEYDMAASQDMGKKRMWIRDAMQSLTDRERFIIKSRKMADDAITLEDLGITLGISKERVRQLEHRALIKLRGVLSQKVHSEAEFFV